jgi:hypothetical protein
MGLIDAQPAARDPHSAHATQHALSALSPYRTVCTLQPHEKFYGMAKFERSESLRKKKEGDKLLRKQMKAAAREVRPPPLLLASQRTV